MLEQLILFIILYPIVGVKRRWPMKATRTGQTWSDTSLVYPLATYRNHSFLQHIVLQLIVYCMKNLESAPLILVSGEEAWGGLCWVRAKFSLAQHSVFHNSQRWMPSREYKKKNNVIYYLTVFYFLLYIIQAEDIFCGLRKFWFHEVVCFALEHLYSLVSAASCGKEFLNLILHCMKNYFLFVFPMKLILYPSSNLAIYGWIFMHFTIS